MLFRLKVRAEDTPVKDARLKKCDLQQKVPFYTGTPFRDIIPKDLNTRYLRLLRYQPQQVEVYPPETS